MNKRCAVTIAPAIIAALLITACGLQGDLYLPGEESDAAPAAVKSSEDEPKINEPGIDESEIDEPGNEETENDESMNDEQSAPSSAPAP